MVMQEKLSALMDGELGEADSALVLKQLGEDTALEQNWQLYHLIGDALRQDVTGSRPVAAAVTARLATEPVVLAPGRVGVKARNAAWYSLAASVAGISLVAWVLWQNAAPVAKPAASSVATAQNAFQQRVGDYWQVHQQMSGHMSDARPSQVRFVADEQPAEDAR